MSTLAERLAVAKRAVVGIFSEDSAKQAYGLLQGIYPGQTGYPPVRGTKQFLEAYSRMPWLRAVAARIATKCATTDWQLYVQKGPDDKKAKRNVAVQRAYHGVQRRKLLKALAESDELKQIETHPLLDVLTDANSFQTGFAMRKVTQIHLDLVGEAFWLKERDALGTVIGVWPIPPDWVVSTPTPANPNFRVSFRGWRGLIPDEEFVWFVDPDPVNPYGRGSGVARSLSDELETDEYAAKHTKAWFYNRARPDLIVYPKNTPMREADVQRLENDWMDRNQGFWRAFKPYFLTREVGITELDQNFRSMQLVQLREYERNTILQVFGIPPEILGVLENSNRATITAADLVMGRYVIEPRLEFMRAILQERLVPEYDERLIIDFVSPVQDDKDFTLDAVKAYPEGFSVDEVRALTGYPAMDDDVGRVHFARTSMRPLDPTEPDGLKPPPPPELVNPDGTPAGPTPPKPKPPNASSTGDDEGSQRRAPWNLLGL